MEGGQKINIPLDSGLDVHSSDMLVPVTQPKFQHNRQKFQGRYLPTSLRYEHNGWAAGNGVYTFDVSYFTIKAGKYNVFKQKINENPSYQINVIEGDDYADIKASAIFNNSSRLLSYDTDSATISAGPDPDLTGYINSKYFSIHYDSAKGTFSLGSSNDSSIKLVSEDIKSDYTASVKIEDTSANVNITFSGMSFPSDIYNGQYLLGKFSLYVDMADTFEKDSAYYVSKWQYNQFMCYYDGSSFWLSVNDSVLKKIDAKADSSGHLQLSFDIDLQFSDSPSVQLVSFFPFFSAVFAKANSNVINTSANENLNCNLWSVSVSDPVNIASNISDKLYRNLQKYSGANDYNTQRMTQKIPVWFGVSAAPLVISTVGQTIARASGDNMLTVHITNIAAPTVDRKVWVEDSEAADGGNWVTVTDHPNSNEAYIYAKCTDTVQGYSGKVRIANVSVWEQTINKSAEYCDHTDRSYNVRVKYSYAQWQYDPYWNSDEDVDGWSEETVHGEDYFTINDNFSFTKLDELKEMFSVSDSSLVHIDSISVDDGLNYRVYINVFKSPFSKQYEYWQAAVDKGGSALTDYLNSVTSNGKGNDYNQIWVDISDEAVIYTNEGHIRSNFKNFITLGSKADYYNKYYAIRDTDEESDLYGHAFWSVCCTGQISSDLYISSDKLLTNVLDASYFTCDPVEVKQYTASEYDALKKDKKYTNKTASQLEPLHLDYMFKHTVSSASYSQMLNISVYLCAAVSNLYSFYIASAPESNTKYIPEHIIFDKVSQASSNTYGNMSGFLIQKVYSDLSANTGYSLYTAITAQAAKTKDDNNYSYIDLLQDSYDNSVLVPGNKFYSEVVSDLETNLSITVANDFKFKVTLNPASSNDWDQLSITGQTLQLHLSSQVLKSLSYMLDGQAPSVEDFNFSYSGYNIAASVSTLPEESASQDTLPITRLSISYKTSDNYALNIAVPMSFDSSWNLISFQNNTALLYSSNSLIQMTIDYTQKVVSVKTRKSTQDKWHSVVLQNVSFLNSNGISALASDVYSIIAVLYGIYSPVGCSVTQVTRNNAILNIDGQSVSVDISENGLFDSSKHSIMQYNYTPVDSNSLDCKTLAECDIEQELQCIKQQWDTTTSTENFWWIDSQHVLVLDKYNFILREKTSDISDWNGDVFIDTASWPRYNILPGTVLKYFVTDAYDGESARLITVTPASDGVLLQVYNPLDGMQIEYSKTLQLVKRSIGQALCLDNKKLYTYSDLDISNVITGAKWSGTCLDGKVIVGLHFDNNFNQWAIIISDEGLQVIQGYGFVGLNGCLTGGEIPEKYFDASRGFTGTVQPLSVLSDSNYDVSDLSELYTFEDRVVGNDSQQWYLSSSIPLIVSHLEYSNGTYSAKSLPLNNNYSINYASASFCSTVFADYNFKVKSLKNLFPESNGVWTALLTLAGWPMVYFFNPKIAIANYLQQTLGQAAYVHYNSTDGIQQQDVASQSDNIHAEVDTVKYNSPVSSDEISFDRQSVRQSQSNSDPYSGSTFLLFASAGVSALDWVQDTVQINKGQNQSAVSDSGNKYSQYFLQNMLSMTGANMQINAITPSQTSEVTAIKTLDMFYSTSDRQQVQAGRGYVNHNFVAQCLAQSVTSVQSVFTQQSLVYAITSLTVYQLQLTHKALVVTRDAIAQQIQANNGGLWFVGGFVNGGNTSAAVAIALGLGWVAAAVACNASEIGLELLPSVIDSLGGGKLQSTITANQSANNRDIEAKHAYGSKHEHFMWPCFGMSTAQSITDESVTVTTINKPWKLDLPLSSPRKQIDKSQPDFTTDTISDSISEKFKGQVPYYAAMLKGTQASVQLPSDMAYVIGTESFLPGVDFKNQNISESAAVFGTPLIQDYILDKNWQLSQTATNGMTLWISARDTKVIDGEYSNCVVSNSFCGVASPYAAIEIKRGIFSKYLRPTLLTPQALGLNITGLNACYEEKAYHAFDGYGYRVVNWMGSAGMAKERQTLAYMFLVNDRFKRSNKLPAYELVGNFKSDPVTAISGDYNDSVFVQVDHPGQDRIMGAGAIGEDKNAVRIALPVFSELVNTLPAAVKTISTQQLSVIDGITSLTTDNRDLQSAYKAPVSIDFTIGRNNYRFTSEYICSLTQQTGVTLVEQLVPCLGLDFIGATPYEAYFYSKDTQQYYIFTGGTSLKMVDMIERFRSVLHGRYDFVSQEVLLPCVATFLRLDNKVLDSDSEVDNVIVPRLKDGEFIGEAAPPIETIYNDRSGFKTLSLPCGVLYQGPNRCIIVRYNYQNYMSEQIKANYGKWRRVPREEYHPFRVYKDSYKSVDKFPAAEVKGWTHNPFLLVTAPLGVNVDTDCLYEWEITFCWPVEMDSLYPDNAYAVVNVQSETMTPGGKVIAARPAHVFLKKDLFTFSGNYGYYSFRYAGKCGAGNRERLHIWSDQYICVSGLQCEYKPVTTQRTSKLVQQADLYGMQEI